MDYQEGIKNNLPDSTSYLRLVSGCEALPIAATNEKTTIAGSEDVFKGGIDSDFKRGLDRPTKQTTAKVYELVKDAHVATMFTSLSGNLGSLCMTDGQIVYCVKEHRSKLQTERLSKFSTGLRNRLKECGCQIFFLQIRECQFFVVSVRVDDDDSVHVERLHFGDSGIWTASINPFVVVCENGVYKF